MPAADHATVERLFHCERSREPLRIIRTLRDRGFTAYFAGGCVRDALLGYEPKDFDVATDATPDSIRDVFGHHRTLPFGASFGVIGVLPPRKRGEGISPDQPTEVATFRSDGTYSDGRRPDSVHYGNAEQDAIRRDFTINGMFYDPHTHRVLDFVGGQQDIRRGVLRTIGDPDLRFGEDKLRMLRAVRFTTTLRFRADPDTAAAIRKLADGIRQVSAERIGGEMRRILVAEGAIEGIRQLIETGLSRHIWPGIEGVDRQVAATLLRELPRDRRDGHLFPRTVASAIIPSGDPSAILRAIAAAWRLSNEEQRQIASALRLWPLLASARQRRWSELQPAVTDRDVEIAVDVAEAVVRSGWRPAYDLQSIDRVREILSWPESRRDPPPLLTGADLKRLGIPPGPAYRGILAEIRVAQLDGELTTPEQALCRARAAIVDPLPRPDAE